MTTKSSQGATGKVGIMAALMVGVFLSPLNVNLTSVALPTIQSRFDVNVNQLAWVATAYFLPMVVLQPLQANLGSRYGVRRVYVLGLALLSLGAFMAAISANFSLLLVSRVVQGIGWSAVYPLALMLIGIHFSADRRGEAMGTWESAVGFAAILGPVVGGLLVFYLGWSSVYIVLGLVAATGAMISLIVIPTAVQPETLNSFDWPGVLGLTVATLLFLLGLIQLSLLLILGSLIAYLGWGWYAGRAREPFVDPSLFANRKFAGASSAATLRMVIGVAALISLPLFLEGVYGLTPAMVGLLLPIYAVFLMVGARPGGRWADRAGGRIPAMVGFVLMTIGIAALLLLDFPLSILLLGGALAIRGVGAGISQAPFAKVAIESVDPQSSGMAGGLYGMIRYSGLAIGSAMVGLVLQRRFAFYGSDGSGPDALPAFQELFFLLMLVGIAGLALSWWMGTGKQLPVVRSAQEVHGG